MKKSLRYTLLALAVVGTAAAIVYLESIKPERRDPGDAEIAVQTQEASEELQGILAEKRRNYERAKELVDPDSFINTEPLTIKSLIGDQVILVDFWTYSCINCQRTLPYLTAWHDKYGDQGLTILGIHTPEFEFEKDYDNVVRATEKFGVEYPVIQDNDYQTWRAYKNRYWPRKYLIDIDGFIVYDHIGEGAYEETEQKIQELLNERAERLGLEEPSTMPTLEQDPEVRRQARSPEVYFGAARNKLLSNGVKNQTGVQTFTEPDYINIDELYLVGDWNITDEYAENVSENAKIIYRYRAKDVFMVASAEEETTITVHRNGEPLEEGRGEDLIMVDGEATGSVQEDQLYKLVQNHENEVHTLEITIEEPGLKAFTFTFGS